MIEYFSLILKFMQKLLKINFITLNLMQWKWWSRIMQRVYMC